MRALKTISVAVIMIAMFSPKGAFSQFDVVGDILRGKDDANKLLNHYLEPIGKGWGYDLAGGWYNTAHTHSTLGFDLTFTFQMAMVPDAGMTFDIADLDLEKISAVETGNTTFPTIANGDDVNSIQIVETFEHGNVSENITILPPTELKGFRVSYIPLPALTGSIGIIKNTDISFRYIPTVGMGDFGNIGMWGLGVKHDILQWLPIVDKVPFLNASIFAGYSNMNFDFDISYQVPEVDDPSGYTNPENQALDANLGSFHGALIVDVNLPFVTPYVSFGITNSTMNMDVLGEYALPKPRFNEDTQSFETYLDADDPEFTLQDPLNLEFKNKLAPSAALGLRVKLAVITFHAQYTYQEYDTVTAGIGISFR